MSTQPSVLAQRDAHQVCHLLSEVANLADLAVEVETIEALHFQRDVPVQQFRDGRNFRFYEGFRPVLVGFRSRTSPALASSHCRNGPDTDTTAEIMTNPNLL
jgi:hypothetical protein